jgi:hypothetical protein
VSRLLRNQLRIGLGPDRLFVAGRRRGFHRTAARTEMMMVEAGREPGEWRPAVEALPAAIALSQLHRPEVTVVLSNQFVRYALLPWNEALRTDEEWLALARHRLNAVHGAPSRDWIVRVSPAAHGSERVASAADRELIEAVRAKVGECGAKLVSAQPNLMATFNAMRKDIGKETCWLVIRDDSRLTLALFERGSWRALRMRRIDAARPTPLREILERECAMLALGPASVRSVLVVQEDFAVNGREGLQLPDWARAGKDDFEAGAADSAMVLATQR